MKKITKRDLSSIELVKALEKLEKLEDRMTSEQRDELKRKKEDIERTRAKRQEKMQKYSGKDEESKAEGNAEDSKIKADEVRNKRKERETHSRSYKILRQLNKIVAAIEKGDTQRAEKGRDDLLAKLLEDEKKILEPVLILLSEANKVDSLKKAIDEAEKKLSEFHDSKDKEKEIEQEKKQQKRELQRKKREARKTDPFRYESPERWKDANYEGDCYY